jgi:integrin beta 3
MFDGKAFGEEMTAIVKGYVDRATAPLEERIALLEARQPERGEKGERGDVGERGATGIGVAGAMIDRTGGLIITLSDGTTRELGSVVGPQGERGEKGDIGTPGEKGLTGDRGEIGERGPAGEKGERGDPGPSGERGERGEKGERGKEGFSLMQFDTKISEDGRTLTLIFEDDEVGYEHEMRFAVPLYRGVWEPGEYEMGDMVTWGGSIWHAGKDTSDKPDAPDSGWKLAVKKGRDGKNAA